MAYLGTQPNDVKKNTGLYTPSEILQLTKDGHWGGSLKFIEEQNVDGTPSEINVTNLADNPFEVYLFEVTDLITNAQQQIAYRFSNDNGSTYIASAGAYQYAFSRITSSGSGLQKRSSSSTNIQTDAYTNVTPSSYNSYIYLYNLLDSSKYSFMNHHSTSVLSNGSYRTVFGGGMYDTAETINAFQIQIGNQFTSGRTRLYGVKQL